MFLKMITPFELKALIDGLERGSMRFLPTFKIAD